jgi:hypothetical protein
MPEVITWAAEWLRALSQQGEELRVGGEVTHNLQHGLLDDPESNPAR